MDWWIINASDEGDIPARDTLKNQAIKTEKDQMELFKRIFDITDKKYLFGRKWSQNFSEHIKEFYKLADKNG